MAKKTKKEPLSKRTPVHLNPPFLDKARVIAQAEDLFVYQVVESAARRDIDRRYRRALAKLAENGEPVA